MAHPLPRPVLNADAHREQRLAWERDRIAEGEADIAAGRVIPDEDLDAWLHDLTAGKSVTIP